MREESRKSDAPSDRARLILSTYKRLAFARNFVHKEFKKKIENIAYGTYW